MRMHGTTAEIERRPIVTTAPQTQTPQTPPKQGMFRELLYIHSLLRRDLQTVRRLAADARDGLDPRAIVAEIRELETNSPLWRLKFGCLYYCRFVHAHHTIEDAAVFPMIRKHDPSLNSVIDRLEEDHLAVHHITERIASIAETLATDPSDTTRAALDEVLGELEARLLAHLALEEEAIGPLLSAWDHWPME
jgi:hypothetical protein